MDQDGEESDDGDDTVVNIQRELREMMTQNECVVDISIIKVQKHTSINVICTNNG